MFNLFVFLFLSPALWAQFVPVKIDQGHVYLKRSQPEQKLEGPAWASLVQYTIKDAYVLKHQDGRVQAFVDDKGAGLSDESVTQFKYLFDASSLSSWQSLEIENIHAEMKARTIEFSLASITLQTWKNILSGTEGSFSCSATKRMQEDEDFGITLLKSCLQSTQFTVNTLSYSLDLFQGLLQELESEAAQEPQEKKRVPILTIKDFEFTTVDGEINIGFKIGGVLPGQFLLKAFAQLSPQENELHIQLETMRYGAIPLKKIFLKFLREASIPSVGIEGEKIILQLGPKRL